MPDEIPPSPPPEGADAAQDPAQRLAEARAALNSIDDQIHALLMERAAIVKERVGTSGKTSPLRPGRQAAVIRRLLANHSGYLPAKNLVCLWLELMAGGTAIQHELVIAVCEADAQFGITQVTREYFGSLVRVRSHQSPAQALSEVANGRADIAVLPFPVEDGRPHETWWATLLPRDNPRTHIIARLPFWRARTEGTSNAKALVLGRDRPDPSGQDCSLLGLEFRPDVSRARLASLLEAAKLKPLSIVLHREPGAPMAKALVEVDGLIDETDKRLDQLDPALQRPVVLGGYPIGIGDEA